MNALISLKNIAQDPKNALNEAIASGKKVIGIMPYFCPEELVYAAGILPFGLWGAEIQAGESKRYFPAFICSILHTTLEMGLRGELDDLSAVMIPISCDSLKGMGANWEAGVKNVPVINVAFAENRKIAAGIEFTRSQFRKILRQIEEIAGTTVSDDDIRKAIAVYNENRQAIFAFSKAAASHPAEVKAADRSAAIKAGYFMDREEHTKLLNEVTAELQALPASDEGYLKIVTTGILADAPRLLEIIDRNKMVIVDDQIAHESVNARYETPDEADPVLAMAERLAEIEGCSVLYDPGKKRGTQLVEMAEKAGADGILFVLTKFCDPEEYDYVPVKRMTDKASIPMLQIEIDQQMTDYGQPESAIQAFAETLR